MSTLWVIVGITLIIVCLTDDETNINQKNLENNKVDMPYEKKDLLTKTEHSFYKILKSKCDEENLIICPKVRLEDIVNVTTRENKLKWRGYIKSRHIDFLLCDYDLNVIAGLELDDYSHNSKKAQQTDLFKNNLFENIGIPLFRIKTNTLYEEEITKLICTIKGEICNYH